MDEEGHRFKSGTLGEYRIKRLESNRCMNRKLTRAQKEGNNHTI